MCITYPSQIKEIDNGIAKNEKGMEIKTSLIPDLKTGDWVLVHANLAIKKITQEEAEEINEILKRPNLLVQIYK
ncbi:HypC/HybG/HupF family hydrogenase formation chaperone [Patescibacteria group bacterium]|nr:HypC/HybG/HupF family hydrogenase formation chaperone [Patescibacteria group bacterium]